VEGKIGGDSDLSERGFKYSKALPDLIKDNIGDAPLTVIHQSLSSPSSHVVTPLLPRFGRLPSNAQCRRRKSCPIPS